MSWKLAPALVQLRSEVLSRFPGTTIWAIGDPDHQARASDHNPIPKGMTGAGLVCAIDVVGTAPATALWDFITSTKPGRIKYAIYKKRIISSTVSPWTIRSFSGHPHDSHIHISVGRGPDGRSTHPSLYNDSSPWGFATTGSTGEDEDMKEFIEHLQTSLNEAGVKDFQNKPLKVDGVWGPRTQSAFVKALGSTGSGGLTATQADARYAKRGVTVSFKLP